MEQESFRDESVAKLLNDHYISIKVDREEYPQIDKKYQKLFLQKYGKRGGWPLSVFFSPNREVFHLATYIPKEEGYGSKGLMKLLPEFAALQKKPKVFNRRIDLYKKLAEEESKRQELKAGVLSQMIQQAVSEIAKTYDEQYGGFAFRPKYPEASKIELLLTAYRLSGDRDALKMAKETLHKMAQSGVYDQVEGGFFRYTTDEAWLNPHFEKMLYNQALLGRVYLKGWQLDGLPRHAQVTRDILDYVLRDMASEQGGFFSATDADSEGHEGKFFVWDRQEIEDALPEDLAKLAIALFNVTDNGNFESSNILYLSQLPETYANENNIPLAQLQQNIRQIREILYQVREQRPHPLRDEKIVTAWNGMMITTLALAGGQFSEPRYTEAAIRAANFVWRHNRRSKGRLYRAHLNGNSSVAASQEDYAWFGEALVTLYDVTSNRLWLERAKEIADGMISQFHDARSGGFYMSSAEAEVAGMGRGKDIEDGATPSGNSVALRLLAQLAARVPPGLEEPGDGAYNYGELADETMAVFATTVEDSPISYSWFLAASEERIKGETGQILYAGKGTVQAKVAVRPQLAKVSDKLWDLSVTLNMADGWHVNSIEPLQDYLKATTLSVPAEGDWVLEEVNYPQSVVRSLGFSREPLSLYEGEVTITATLKQTAAQSLRIPLSLQVQSCSDQVCLAPEELSLSVSTAIE